MRHVCIVGVGLIGGSLGKALRRGSLKKSYRVTGLVRDAKKARRAVVSGAVDEASNNPAILKTADVVVFCVPVQSIAPLAAKVATHLKKGAIVTDAGSVKGPVVAGLKKVLGRSGVSVVGAHPMAGSEASGVENARANLFDGATCVITTPAPDAPSKIVRKMWVDAGARCVAMPAGLHDDLVAFTSHLPHLLAFSLFSVVSKRAKTSPAVRAVAATSFRDMTRVAASDPDVWNGILEVNRGAIARALKSFVSGATALQRAKGAGLRARLSAISRGKKAWRP